MLSTVIRDAYRQGEATLIADALEDLCSPQDAYGWASAGIYCFWNIDTRDPLNIGLAVDLGARFRQHNGLKPCIPAGCKVRQIADYFENHERIGYSVLVQSPLDQPIIARNAIDANGDADLEESIELVGAGEERIVLAEGALIEACVKAIGVRPPWNKIGGSREGQQRARIEHFDFVSWLVARQHPPFIARGTLREISGDPGQEGFEEDLHGARMVMMTTGMTFEEAVAWLKGLGGIHAERVGSMRSSQYLARPAPFEN